MRMTRSAAIVSAGTEEGVRRADALLIVTPEYSYSIPGVLKNALDWACRPRGQRLVWEAAAIMGASPGAIEPLEPNTICGRFL